MNLVPLSQIFDIEYGNQLNLNAMKPDENGINFISRSSRNLGVVDKVRPVPGLEPYDSGLITVTLGGTYLLSSFVQPRPFYTAQNIKVLIPKNEMDFATKVFYCLCISKNRFRYSSHGREANKSLDEMVVPLKDETVKWIKGELNSVIDKEPIRKAEIDIFSLNKDKFKLEELFAIERGRGARKTDIVEDGVTPFITSIDKDNGLAGYVNNPPSHSANVISVNRNGSVAEAFYQDRPFCSTEDVHIFVPKFEMNIFHALYLIPILNKEKFRYTYGRKWGIERMNNTMIELPINKDKKPAWNDIEKYMMSLPYSKNLINSF